MPTPPYSREPSLRLSSPEPERPAFTRSGSSAIAPKSEYLRNALQARRAKNTSTPPLSDARPPPPTPATPLALLTPRTSPDLFDKFELTEEYTTPVSPVRRQRPGETGLPLSKTNRELTTEVERLKDSLMTSKMRVELLKKNNHELQIALTKAKEDAEQVEVLEEDNATLSNENNLMRAKLERYEDEVFRLRDANQNLREANETFAATSNESVLQFETQDVAFNDAIEIIASLEDEKDALKRELQSIKTRVAAIESSNTSPLHVDGSPGYPVRVCSIDESCPSTTHFDSDYYSQPESPQRDPEKALIQSNRSLCTSVRSKRFLELSLQHRQSAQDLTKRMSQASLRATSLYLSAISPEIPQVPRQPEQATSDRAEDVTNVARRRRREPSYLELLHQPYSTEASQQPLPRPVTANPQLGAPRASGLRGMYNPSEAANRRQSHDHHSSSSCALNPSNSPMTWSRQSSLNSSPSAPPRTSSKHAYTGSFEELAKQNFQRLCETDVIPTNGALDSPEFLSSSWAAPQSVTSDLTSVVPDPRDKDRWWKSVDRLTQAEAKVQQPKGGPDDAAHLKTFRARNRLVRASSSPHTGTTAMYSDDEQSLKRSKARIFSRRRE
jgi:hypothetical protein